MSAIDFLSCPWCGTNLSATATKERMAHYQACEPVFRQQSIRGAVQRVLAKAGIPHGTLPLPERRAR